MQPLLSVSHAWTMINPRFGLGQLPQDWFSMVVVSATHLQNMLVKLDRFHLVVYGRPKAFAPFIHEAVVFLDFCNMFFAKSKTPNPFPNDSKNPNIPCNPWDVPSICDAPWRFPTSWFLCLSMTPNLQGHQWATRPLYRSQGSHFCVS